MTDTTTPTTDSTTAEDGVFGIEADQEAIKWFMLQMETQRILETLIEEADAIYVERHGEWAGEPPTELTEITHQLASEHSESRHLLALFVATSMFEAWRGVAAEHDLDQKPGDRAGNVLQFGPRA